LLHVRATHCSTFVFPRSVKSVIVRKCPSRVDDTSARLNARIASPASADPRQARVDTTTGPDVVVPAPAAVAAATSTAWRRSLRSASTAAQAVAMASSAHATTGPTTCTISAQSFDLLTSRVIHATKPRNAIPAINTTIASTRRIPLDELEPRCANRFVKVTSPDDRCRLLSDHPTSRLARAVLAGGKLRRTVDAIESL
jgi:hypothetical protein